MFYVFGKLTLICARILYVIYNRLAASRVSFTRGISDPVGMLG